MITGAQARAARAMLQIDVRSLAELAGVATGTIMSLEHDKKVQRGSATLIKTALEGKGVEFLDGNGVRLAP